MINDKNKKQISQIKKKIIKEENREKKREWESNMKGEKKWRGGIEKENKLKNYLNFF
jgi:hypothetical protein